MEKSLGSVALPVHCDVVNHQEFVPQCVIRQAVTVLLDKQSWEMAVLIRRIVHEQLIACMMFSYYTVTAESLQL